MPRTAKPTNRGMVTYAICSFEKDCFSRRELREKATELALDNDVVMGVRTERYQDIAINTLILRKILSLEDGQLCATADAEELVVNAGLVLHDRIFATKYERYAAWTAYYNENTKPAARRSATALVIENEDLRERVLILSKRPDSAEIGVQCSPSVVSPDTPAFRWSTYIDAMTETEDIPVHGDRNAGGQRTPSPTRGSVRNGNSNSFVVNSLSTPIRRFHTFPCYLPTPESIPPRQQRRRHELLSPSPSVSKAILNPAVDEDSESDMNVDDSLSISKVAQEIGQADEHGRLSPVQVVRQTIMVPIQAIQEHVPLVSRTAVDPTKAISDVQAGIEDLQAEIEAFNRRIAELNQQVVDLKTSLSAEQASNAELQAKLSEAERDLEQHRTRVKELEVEVASKDVMMDQLVPHMHKFLTQHAAQSKKSGGA
ncbi:hypothetical protein SCP_1001040 [Sparassis crispa]|uniref:Uncharacterized protein n=1 Tax=Sparassis crispa TaxID=139825 RepID=A0A401GXF0_9APHY|nr:hypothetical protein SCP_1001040 [Sparassis crispa]GBE86862.1 hypothetical protein SCP_1001040 [Sparassis crispa]